MALSKTKITTASTVQWSDGTNFNGFILALLALPSGYSKAHIRGYQGIQVPARGKIPIIDGAVQSFSELWETDQISPPTTRYCLYWYDDTETLIASGDALAQFTASEYSTTPPTLTAPTAASECPSIDPPAASSLSAPSTYPTVEEVTGTKNGSNKTFTVSSTPLGWLGLYYNGALLKEGTDYSRSGTTITIAAAFPAPVSADSLQAVYWA